MVNYIFLLGVILRPNPIPRDSDFDRVIFLPLYRQIFAVLGTPLDLSNLHKIYILLNKIQVWVVL